MSRWIEISPEVETVMGSTYAADYRAGPYPEEFTCAQCGEDGSITQGDAVTISAVHYQDATQLVIRHTSCGPSEILEVDAAYSEVVEPPDAKGVCVVRKDADPLAMFICASSQMVVGGDRSDGGDMSSLLTTFLLEDGFELLLDMPWYVSGPSIPRWSLTCAGSIMRVERSREGAQPFVLFEGEMDLYSEWLQEVRRTKQCLVVTGDGLSLDGDALDGLEAAIPSGRMVAGVVSASTMPTPAGKDRKARRAARHRRN